MFINSEKTSAFSLGFAFKDPVKKFILTTQNHMMVEKDKFKENIKETPIKLLFDVILEARGQDINYLLGESTLKHRGC